MAMREPHWTLKEFAESKGITERALRGRMERSGIKIEGQALNDMRGNDSRYLQNKRGATRKKVYPIGYLSKVLGGLV